MIDPQLSLATLLVRGDITMPVVAPQICLVKHAVVLSVWAFYSENVMFKSIHGMLTAVIAVNCWGKYFPPHCLFPVKLNSWELCFSQEELFLALALGTEMHGRVKPRVFPSLFCACQCEQAGEEIRGLELAHT